MSGNVYEWVWDRMECDEDEEEIVGGSVYRHGPVTDPYGSAVGSSRVFRGGTVTPTRRKFERRTAASTTPRRSRTRHLGFRIVRSL